MSCRCALSPGAQGRCNHCYSVDTERCLLSSFPFSSMMCQLSVVESKSATFPSERARHLLDDSVLESRSPRRGLALASSAVTNGLSLGKRLWPAHDSRWPRPGVCSCLSVPVQRPVAPHPCRKGPLQESPEPGRPLLPGLWCVMKCPGRVLVLLVALSIAGRGREQPTPEARRHWVAPVGAWLLPQ